MLGIMSGGVALAAEYQFTFLTHAGEENSFWAAVYRELKMQLTQLVL